MKLEQQDMFSDNAILVQQISELNISLAGQMEVDQQNGVLMVHHMLVFTIHVTLLIILAGVLDGWLSA